MRRRILFVNPWIHDFAAYDVWSRPIGLLYLAAIFRRNGYDVELLDCLNSYHPSISTEKGLRLPKGKPDGSGSYPRAVIDRPGPLSHIPKRYRRYGITPGIFKRTLMEMSKPAMVFVTSVMTYWYPGVFEAIGLIRAAWPDIPIVLGGIYATLCPDHAQRSGADVVVSGPGEDHLAEIVKDLLHEDLSFAPGPDKLDDLPYPAFDLQHKIAHVPLMTSRGCPFQCTYCASRILYPHFSTRDPLKVFDEIAFWHQRYGVRHFSFYDDALLADPQARILPLLTEVIRRDLNCQFHSPNGLHLREVDERLASLLFRSGFRTLRFGYETADRKRQGETGGKVRDSHLREAVTHLRGAGYGEEDIGIYVMCGLPGQPAAEVQETIRHVRSCGARPIITEYSPIPGTALWMESLKASPFPLDLEPLFHNNSLFPCLGGDLTGAMYQDLKRQTRSGPPPRASAPHG